MTVDEQVDGIQDEAAGTVMYRWQQKEPVRVRVLEIRDTWSDRQEPGKERKSAMKRMLYQALSAP